jgi:hypothetical protein
MEDLPRRSGRSECRCFDPVFIGGCVGLAASFRYLRESTVLLLRQFCDAIDMAQGK